jgi:hypothetical protein
MTESPADIRNSRMTPSEVSLQLFEELVAESIPRYNRPGEYLAINGHPDSDTFTVELFTDDNDDEPVQRFTVVVDEATATTPRVPVHYIGTQR